MKFDAAEPEIFLIPCVLPCQNLTPTLPTMQLNRRQFGQRFVRVMLVAGNVASSRDKERATEVW